MEHVDDHWRRDDEGEQEGGAEPVDCRFVCAEVDCCVGGDRGECEPLQKRLVASQKEGRRNDGATLGCRKSSDRECERRA